MGKCCKCGKETPHVYAYWSGDAPDRKTCVNVEEHAAFLCTRCAMASRVILDSAFLATWIVILVVYIVRKQPDIVSIIHWSVMAVLYLGALLHTLFVGRRDKKLPFYASKELAEKRIVKIMRKKNPGKKYFAPSEYH